MEKRLITAVEHGEVEIVKDLLNQHGVNIQKYPELLWIAIKNNYREIVEILLRNKIDIEATDEDGMTALLLGVYYDQEEIVEMLLSMGANVNVKTNKEQRTSLHLACKTMNFEVVEKLLKYKADINAQDMDGRTALHIAFDERGTEVVQLLLDARADVNILDNDNCLIYDVYNPSIFDSHIDQVQFMFQDDYEEACEILKLHLIMLKAADLYVSERDQILMYYGWGNYTRLFAQKCEDEIQQLKLEKIASYKLSFYDILTKNTHSLANYAKNKDVIRVFESNYYKTKFPISARIIERNFLKSTERLILLERAQDILKYYFKLPYECSEHILSYLSDADIKKHIKSLKRSNKEICRYIDSYFILF